MATKNFGIHNGNVKMPQARNYTAEMQELVGAHFPITLSLDRDNNLLGATYSTEWQEGGTKPIYEGKGRQKTVVDYEENYKSKQLTADQIKKIDQYLSENITKVSSGQSTQNN